MSSISKEYIKPNPNTMSLRKCFYWQWRLWSEKAKGISTAKSIANIKYPYEGSCVSCTYDEVMGDGACGNCPSTEIWKIGRTDTYPNIECDDTGSPYDKWDSLNFSDYDSLFFAQIIADESKRLLQENL